MVPSCRTLAGRIRPRWYRASLVPMRAVQLRLVTNPQANESRAVVSVRVEDVADNLREAGSGLWVARSSSAVSYPTEGHDQCFAIEDNSFWFTHRNEIIAEVMRRFPPCGTVFDIGGGNGFVAAGLREAGFEAVLVEPGLDGARNAVRRGLDPVICASLDSAGFRDGSLPAVGLFDVIEHVEDDVAFLRSLRRLIRQGGRLYATVPVLPWLWSVEDERAGHYRRYTIDAFERLLSDCGFTVEFSTSFFRFLVAPVFLRRAIPSRLGLRSGTGDEYVAEHAPSSTWSQRVLRHLSASEFRRIRSGRIVKRGTSCIVVARADR